MGDLNFFEDYIDKRELKLNKKIAYFSLLGLLFISLTGYIFYNFLTIKREEKIIEELRLVAQNPEVLKKIEEIQQKEIEVDQLRQSVEYMQIADKAIHKGDKINAELLDNINKNMPNSIFLTSFDIQKDEIYLIGRSKDKWSVAEFQRGLEILGDEYEIFVSNIMLEEGYYNFILEITLREEAEQEIEEVQGEDEKDAGTDEK